MGRISLNGYRGRRGKEDEDEDGFELDWQCALMCVTKCRRARTLWALQNPLR